MQTPLVPFLRPKDIWLTSRAVRIHKISAGHQFIQLQNGTAYKVEAGTHALRRATEKPLPKKVRRKMKRAIELAKKKSQ